MRNQYAKLDVNKKIIPCSVEEWAAMFEESDERRVKRETINGLDVSTVFLGLNHGYGEKSLWFETMIFGLEDEYQERCETWDEALKMHDRAVKFAEEQKT